MADLSRRNLAALAIISVAAACAPRPTGAPLTVFAAASLTDVLEALAADWRRDGGEVRLSFASSGAVARQIQAGAPADLVILADPQWMDRLDTDGLIRRATRVDLLSNRLVVIAPVDVPPPDDPLRALFADAPRVAIGDPESVPAGRYARDWLTSVGQWAAVRPRLVAGADVRAVRAFVSRGEADLGLVYRSDAVDARDVRIVFEPPEAQQPSIRYPAALTSAASEPAADFLAMLRSPAAAAVFRRYGFEPLV